MAHELLLIFVIFKCFAVCFRHGAPSYIEIPYLANSKSQAFWIKLPIQALPSNRPAAVLLVITCSAASDNITAANGDYLQLIRNSHRETGKNTEPSV